MSFFFWHTLYLRNDSIHEHNTRGCHQLTVLDPGAKTFSNISARIWNVLTNILNCDVSMSIFKCNLKTILILHNELSQLVINSCHCMNISDRYISLNILFSHSSLVIRYILFHSVFFVYSP